MPQRNKVVISEKGKRRILAGHRWIYKSDIISDESDGADVVFLFDKKRGFLGTALYSRDSEIALRLISRDEIRDIGRHIEEALIRADHYRRLLDLNGDCMRLVHSESDDLPALIVDMYADTIVFQTLSRPVENLKDLIIRKLKDVINPRQIFEKNDSSTRDIEGLPKMVRTVYGPDRSGLFCIENHHLFCVDFINSQKTSEYLDQKVNRAIVSRYAYGRVLDLFCYHGWFSCNIEDYNELILVDSSKEALKIAEKNLLLNNKKRFRLEEGNVFDFLRDMEKAGERFDTIILDPPGFIKGRKDKERGYRGYKEINLRAMKILNRGGILVTFSCSYYMSDEEFLKMLMDAAADTKGEFIIREYLQQSPDHKWMLGFPESHYLKGYILEKIN